MKSFVSGVRVIRLKVLYVTFSKCDTRNRCDDAGEPVASLLSGVTWWICT